MSSAISYSESVYLQEYRIQAGLNASACLDSATLMVAKDYFMAGTFSIAEFGCTVSVINDLKGNITLNVKAVFNGVSARESGSVSLGSN